MREAATISQIEKQLRRSSPEKLAVVLDFVSYLTERQPSSEAFQTSLASEQVLRKDWKRPEEDEVWADL